MSSFFDDMQAQHLRILKQVYSPYQRFFNDRANRISMNSTVY